MEEFAPTPRTRTNPEGRRGRCNRCRNTQFAIKYAALVAADPDGVHAAQAEKRKTHPEQQTKARRNWEKKNPDKNAAKRLRRRACLANAPFIEYVDLNMLYLRDKGICQLCYTKCRREDASADHIIPVSLGGATSYQNEVLAHLSCNSRKNNRTVTQQMRLFG